MPGMHTRGGFGLLRNSCPVCGARILLERPRQRLGPFNVCPGCKAICPICGEVVTEPPLGRMAEVDAWCNQPAHTSCKRERG